MANLSIIESATVMGCCEVDQSSSSSNFESEQDLDLKGNNNTIFHSNNAETESTFPKRQAINISFKNLRFTVKKINFSTRKYERKELLKGISGDFDSGKLTAIMGPSGAGKSTLLNVLAGYVETGVSGAIEVNGKLRTNSFRKSSAYIHQDDVLRPWLKVSEAMMIAAHLKLGFNVTHEHKTKLVKKILLLLGLDQRYNTFTGKLSGGQKKRLAIALELISNPPVLFLDEPTSGLDSSSCTQCISLLKKLAQEGRTVICTIHQPSALLFEMFDSLYCISQGYCIYQGIVKELVPFLSDMGLNCPSYHNPADFMIEVASGEYDTDIPKMAKAALKRYEKNSVSRMIQEVETFERNGNVTEFELKDLKTTNEKTYEFASNGMNGKKGDDQGRRLSLGAAKINIKNDIVTYKNSSANIVMQFILLFQRNFICLRRNYKILLTRLLAHSVIGAIFGYIYTDVGYLATTVLGNYVYMYGSMLLVVYTGKMSVMMSFPTEMEMLKREHFNRWYNLVPYFLSVITFEIPFQMICAGAYVVISFWLTGNYHETWRFVYFISLAILATLSAQSWGFFIGATLPVKIAVFAGPILAVLMSVFGFCNRYVDITPLFRWMWHISYFRVGFHGILNTVYGMNHEDLVCPDSEMYCHFKSSKVFLQDMMIADISMWGSVIMLASVIIVMHFMTLFALWFKLNKR